MSHTVIFFHTFIRKIKHTFIFNILEYSRHLYSAFVNIELISNVRQVYQGLHTCEIFALSFLSAAAAAAAYVFLLVGISFGAASVPTSLLPDCRRVSSVGKQGSAFTSPTGLSVTFVSSCAFGWIRRSLCRAGARPGPLSVVLIASSPPREPHRWLDSCDNIQRSIPFTPSVISMYWSTFATQRRKPLW